MSVRMSAREELVDPEQRHIGQPRPSSGIQLTSIGGSAGRVIVYDVD